MIIAIDGPAASLQSSARQRFQPSQNCKKITTQFSWALVRKTARLQEQKTKSWLCKVSIFCVNSTSAKNTISAEKRWLCLAAETPLSTARACPFGRRKSDHRLSTHRKGDARCRQRNC